MVMIAPPARERVKGVKDDATFDAWLTWITKGMVGGVDGGRAQMPREFWRGPWRECARQFP
jgi:hypothetical protein